MALSRLSLYTRTVSLIGAAAVVAAVPGLTRTPAPLQWALFTILVLMAARFTSRIPSVEATISASDTFFIAAVLLFGPGPAIITVAADGMLLSLRKGHNWNRVWFNAFAPALSLGVAAQTFFFSSGVPPLAASDVPVSQVLLPLLSLTVIYFAFNSGLAAVAVALESHQSVERVWRQHFAGLWLTYFAGASAALCLVVITKEVGLLALPVILPVLAAFHLTLRASFGRVEDAERHAREVDGLYRSTVETLAMAMDAKDSVTHSHVRRVEALATALAKAVGVSDPSTLRALRTAALLHDTGKLAVPEFILNKPGRLSSAEFDQIKRHVDIGADILSLVPFPYPVVPIVRGHHENWDGSGYPRGLSGTDIPIGARILAVVDCYEALTSDRPYRRRMTDAGALAVIRDARGTMYDPEVLDTFLGLDAVVRVADGLEGQNTHVLEQFRQPSCQTAVGPPAEPIPTLSRPSAREEPRSPALPDGRDAACPAGALTQVLRVSARLVHEIVPETTGAWFMVDIGRTRLDPMEPFGPAAHVLCGRTVRIGEKLTGWVAAYRQPILNSDAALDLGDLARACVPPLTHCLSVPIADGESLVGVLSLYTAQFRPFSQDQARALQQMVPTVVTAIREARAGDMVCPSP